MTARGGINNYALSNELTATMKAENITSIAENGSSSNHGLWNVNNATLVLHGASLTARGGIDAYGIYSGGSDTSLKAESVTALGENGSGTNYGLYVAGGIAKAVSSQFTGISAGLNLDSGTVHLGVSQLGGGAINPSSTLTCFQVYDSSYIAYTCP